MSEKLDRWEAMGGLDVMGSRLVRGDELDVVSCCEWTLIFESKRPRYSWNLSCSVRAHGLLSQMVVSLSQMM